MARTTSDLFKEFLRNIGVKNSSGISKAYKEITQKLNQKYYSSDNDSQHCRQIGSYGRNTAINGISDLDMAFELPESVYNRFNAYSSGGQSALLQEIKREMQNLYPNEKDNINGDGQVIGVPRDGFHVEILPTFFLTTKQNSSELDLDIYTYPDTNNGGRWRPTKPRKEMRETTAKNDTTNNNYRRLCRMIRAWRNTHGVGCSGLWIDTLCYNFLCQTTLYNESSFSTYGEMAKDFFKYLVDQREINPEQKKWAAPGSRQTVHGSWHGHKKMKKAYQLCLEALDEESKSHDNWISVFGENFPIKEESTTEMAKAFKGDSVIDNEQFIERKFRNKIDIKNQLKIDYRISDETKTWRMLRQAKNLLKLPRRRELTFYIASTNVIPPYQVLWKVRNSGSEAIRNNCLRGLIYESSQGNNIYSVRKETTSFEGKHWVEAYIIKNGICVARNSIDVPI